MSYIFWKQIETFSRRLLFECHTAHPNSMDGVARGEEEEVFETPDIALSEDDIALESGSLATKDGRNDNVNKVRCLGLGV